MSYIDLRLTKLTGPQLLSIFGDATVTPANNIESENRNHPKHWIKENLSVKKFISEWHRFQASINQEPAFP